MPIISKKGHNMSASPIRKLVPYAEQATKNGKSIYYLNIGQPDIKTPEVALEAVKQNDIKILSYSRSEGSEDYRKKIANYYLKNNISSSMSMTLPKVKRSASLPPVVTIISS